MYIIFSKSLNYRDYEQIGDSQKTETGLRQGEMGVNIKEVIQGSSFVVMG